jgi:hypothetical protein
VPLGAMAPLEMNEGTTSGVGYNKLNSFSVEDPAKRPLTFLNLSIPITQKCQILSCDDTLVANERYLKITEYVE